MTVEAGFAAIIKRNGTAIGKVKSIKSPNLSVDMIDVTTMDSANSYKETLPSLIDGGEISFEALFDAGDAQQVGLYSDLNNKTLQTFTILPKSESWSWTVTGYVTGIEQDIPMDDAISLNVTIKVSGVPLLATSASTGISALTVRDQDDGGECTAANYLPNWAIGTFSYGITYTTATSFRIRATAASHTIKMYVDDVYLENLNSGVSSSAVALSADASKKVKLIAYEANKTPKTYELQICRIS